MLSENAQKSQMVVGNSLVRSQGPEQNWRPQLPYEAGKSKSGFLRVERKMLKEGAIGARNTSLVRSQGPERNWRPQQPYEVGKEKGGFFTNNAGKPQRIRQKGMGCTTRKGLRSRTELAAPATLRARQTQKRLFKGK